VRPRVSLAALLSLGAALVLLAGITAAVVRHGTGAAPAAATRPAAATATPSPTATPTPSPTASPAAATVRARRSAHRHHHHAPRLTALPFTGPAPIWPSLAVALLLLVAGVTMLQLAPVPARAEAGGVDRLARTSRRRAAGGLQRLRGESAVDRLCRQRRD
jgi:hypothetical protein